VVIVINNVRVELKDHNFGKDLQQLYDEYVYSNGTMAGQGGRNRAVMANI